MSRESRPPPEESPASGPKERRDEFLRARGMDDDCGEVHGELDENAEEADCGSPEDGDAVIDRDEVIQEDKPAGS